jgi:hypothetical protein
VLILQGSAFAQISPDKFKNPPDSAKPRTWMHMMNQNLSKEGLEKDLQSLSDAGLGGALIFSVSLDIPKGPVEFNSPEFRSIIQHGVKKADELGLEMGVHNCDGWTSSGGPWITPEDSMKQVVFSETIANGGEDMDIALEKPRSMYGFYRDIGVVAVPATAKEKAALGNRPTLSASSSEGLPRLDDGKIDTSFTVKANRGETKRWVQFSYEQPFTARSIYLENWTRNVKADLYSSADGKTFSKIAQLTSIRTGKFLWAFENNFDEVTARYFRVQFNIDAELAHVSLSSDRRMPHWMGQISILSKSDYGLSRSLRGDKKLPITKLDQVLDLTDSCAADGKLNAKLPAGLWRIYRFGYTSTGAMNSPATDKGHGLECDKLKASALEKHFSQYVGKIAQESGALSGKAFRFSEIDSYEVGGQNWTEGYAEMFQEAYGYGMIKFLPLYAGRGVESLETSNAVLRDLRAFTCDLMVENYYKRFTELCHDHGMVSYIENYGFGPINGLTAGGFTDIPMGEFWIDDRPATHVISPISAAHTYGKPVISAEAFTSVTVPNWNVHPYMLKRKGDWAWTKGINEFMFHRFAHQANTEVTPGMSMSRFGSHIDSTQTWWLNAGKAWMKYIQRGSWMLRQGVPVNDLLIYVGEGSPHKPTRRSSLRKLPSSNNYDFCDTEVLLNRVKVLDGKLVLPEGTTYQAVYFQHPDEMSMKVLKRVGELADQGAKILIRKPKQPIGYMEQQTKLAEFKKLANEIWTKHNQRLIATSDWEHVFSAAKIEPDCVVKGDPSALFIHRKDGDADFYFVHNTHEKPTTLEISFRVGDRVPELWYPDSGKVEVLAQYTQQDGRTDVPIAFEPLGAAFVVFRKPSAALDPIASIEPAGAKAVVDVVTKRIQLSSSIAGNFSLTHASGKTTTVEVPALEKPLPVDGSWKVQFNGLGVQQPNELEFPQLSDWQDHQRDDIRHFSGTAVYRKSFDVSKQWMSKAQRLYLDLGQVDIAADVMLNGQELGTLWKPPFKVEVTDQLLAGTNELVIKVTNQWNNRLVGDERFEKTDGYSSNMEIMPAWYSNNRPLPAGKRSTFLAYEFYKRKSTLVLMPSGLQGPVSLVQEAVVTLSDE